MFRDVRDWSRAAKESLRSYEDARDKPGISPILENTNDFHGPFGGPAPSPGPSQTGTS